MWLMKKAVVLLLLAAMAVAFQGRSVAITRLQRRVAATPTGNAPSLLGEDNTAEFDAPSQDWRRLPGFLAAAAEEPGDEQEMNHLLQLKRSTVKTPAARPYKRPRRRSSLILKFHQSIRKHVRSTRVGLFAFGALLVVAQIARPGTTCLLGPGALPPPATSLLVAFMLSGVAWHLQWQHKQIVSLKATVASLEDQLGMTQATNDGGDTSTAGQVGHGSLS